jgi:hypothetical protein
MRLEEPEVNKKRLIVVDGAARGSILVTDKVIST